MTEKKITFTEPQAKMILALLLQLKDRFGELDSFHNGGGYENNYKPIFDLLGDFEIYEPEFIPAYEVRKKLYNSVVEKLEIAFDYKS